MIGAEGLNYIFLLCSERSGSNLITRIFNAHSQVCGPAPTHIGSDVLGNLHRYSGLSGGASEPLVKDILDLFNTKIGQWKTQLVQQTLVSEIERTGIAEAYLRIYTDEAAAHGKSVVFIKENRLYDFVVLLAPVLAHSRFLYVHRDPRDMALSWKGAPALRGGVVRAANIWANDQAKYLRMGAQLRAIAGQRIPRLGYEELLAEPEDRLDSVCDALGIAFENNMLEFHSMGESRAHADSVAEWDNIGSPLIRSNAGRYREGLSADEIQYVESICQEAMTALGYVPEYERLEGADLEALHAQLAPNEPWEKPAYLELPGAQREKRKRQHTVFTRIRTRAIHAAS